MAKSKKVATKGKKSVEKGKPEVVEVETMSDEDVTRLMMPEIGIEVFSDPWEMSHVDLENRARELIKNRHQNEAELSCILYTMQEKNLPQDHGYETKEYFDSILHISPSKASEMANNWRMLIGLGIDAAKRIAGLSWSKLKLLRVGIISGAINKRNIDSWLEKCAISGKKLLTHSDLVDEVKKLVGRKAKDDADDTIKTVTFKIPAYELESLGNFEEMAKKILDTEDRGRMFIQAIEEFMANHINMADAATVQAMGLAKLKETAERIAPVTAIFVARDETVVKQLGTPAVVASIFQGYDKEGDQQLKYCIAANKTDAKKTLGAKDIQEFPLHISPALQPADPFRYPSEEELVETPVTIDDTKKAASSATSPVSPDAPTWMAPKEIVRPRITEICKELGINSDEYKNIKARVKNDLKEAGENLTPEQGILRWLINKKEGRA